MNSSHTQKPRAFMLVELLAVMACLTILFSVSIVLFFQTFEFQVRNEERINQNLSTNRLVEQFRADVRRAAEVQIAPEDSVLIQWNLPENQTLRYELRTGEFPEKTLLVRSLYGENTLIETETYHLPDRSKIRFVQGKDEFQGLIALSLWSDAVGTATPDVSQLDPFTRTVPEPDAESRLPYLDPKYAGNWRTIIVHQAGGGRPETGG